MSRRLLFVDDEPQVLQVLERLLEPLRSAWEMSFVSKGETALSLLQALRYEVIVTDLRMPGMNGAELLKEVRRQSPQTVRLVLSSPVEQPLALECVGLAHQYLSKPANAEYLRKTITRVTELGWAVHCESLLRLMAKLESLPSLPAVFRQVTALLEDPNSTPNELGDCIAQDTALTAQILKIVNSAFFGLAQKVVNPAEAVTYLGTQMIHSILIAATLLEQFTKSRHGQSTAAHVMNHGRKVAAAARSVAQCEGISRMLAEECFVAGLLHDIGKIILASHAPEVAQEGPMKARDFDEERTLFGATHTEVGSYLLGLWGLPPAAIEAAQFHHTPRQAEARGLSSTLVVHVADALVPREPGEGDGPSAPLDLEYLTELGLAERLPMWQAAVEQSAAALKALPKA